MRTEKISIPKTANGTANEIKIYWKTSKLMTKVYWKDDKLWLKKGKRDWETGTNWWQNERKHAHTNDSTIIQDTFSNTFDLRKALVVC